MKTKITGWPSSRGWSMNHNRLRPSGSYFSMEWSEKDETNAKLKDMTSADKVVPQNRPEIVGSQSPSLLLTVLLILRPKHKQICSTMLHCQLIRNQMLELPTADPWSKSWYANWSPLISLAEQTTEVMVTRWRSANLSPVQIISKKPPMMIISRNGMLACSRRRSHCTTT